jgi:hypothetical protein
VSLDAGFVDRQPLAYYDMFWAGAIHLAAADDPHEGCRPMSFALSDDSTARSAAAWTVKASDIGPGLSLISCAVI